MTSQAGMISARTKAVLAAAKRHGVKLGGDPWGSIDGQGTSSWVGNGCVGVQRVGGVVHVGEHGAAQRLGAAKRGVGLENVEGRRSTRDLLKR
jgi:hypothetical protein